MNFKEPMQYSNGICLWNETLTLAFFWLPSEGERKKERSKNNLIFISVEAVAL